MTELQIGIPQIQTMKDVIEDRISGVQSWLLAQQRDDGSWKGSAWHTAKIMMSLIETGVNPQNSQLKDGYRWLIGNKEQRGPTEVSWEGWTWDTALVVRCLLRLNYSESEKYIISALNWMRVQERRDIQAPSHATYFGRCYTAQVAMAMIEYGINKDDLDLQFFVSTMQQQQEPDGSWLNNFDTSQIVEALVKANSERTWTVDQRGKIYEGGLTRAVRWIERRQSRFGNWDGLTWTTAWTLRAYLWAAETYNPKVITLALGWLLEQKSSRNPSWFNEQGRSASCMITLKTVLDKLDATDTPYLDLNMRPVQFYLGFERFSKDEESRLQEGDEARVLLRMEQLEKENAQFIVQLEEERTENELLGKCMVRLRTRIRLIVEFTIALVFFVLAVVGFFYAYPLASYVLAILGIVLTALGLLEAWHNKSKLS